MRGHLPSFIGEMTIIHQHGYKDVTMAKSTIRVLLVNECLEERQGLAALLLSLADIVLVGEARNGAEALELCAAAYPDVVLTDLLLPDMDGASLIRAIRRRQPHIQVIVLTHWEEYELVQRALMEGAGGFLPKSLAAEELANGIRATAPARKQTPGPMPKTGLDLTMRELDVLSFMVQGLTNRQIAAQLALSRATVKYHVSNILGKMGASTRTEAAALAVQNRLIGRLPSPLHV